MTASSIGALKHLYSSTDIYEEDKVNISRMVEHLLARGVSKARAAKYIYHLLVLARVAGKPFKSLGREDIERLVSWINASDYTEHTKHDYYKIILKKFYQWLRGCSEEEHQRSGLREKEFHPKVGGDAWDIRAML